MEQGVCGQSSTGWQQCQAPKRDTNLMCSRNKRRLMPHSASQPQVGLGVSAWFLCFPTALRRTCPGWPAGPRRMKDTPSTANQAQPRGANSPPICTSQRRNNFHFKPGTGISLLVWWLIIHLPTQGTEVQSHMPWGN